MKSFIYSENKWIQSTPIIPKFEFFKQNLDNSKTISGLARLFLTINSYDHFNLFITKSRLWKTNNNNALRWIKDFQYSSLMDENTFPINITLKKSQFYCFDDNNPDILLCFCGDKNQLNIPLLVFHATYSRLFGSVAYIFKHDFNHFLRNIESIFTIAPSHAKLSLLGTSNGAHIPLLLKHKYPSSSVLSFSPVQLLQLDYLIKLSSGINPQFRSFNDAWSKNTRVYYSGAYIPDRMFSKQCKRLMNNDTFSRVFNDISHLNPSHCTLQTLFQHNLLDKVMNDFRNGRL